MVYATLKNSTLTLKRSSDVIKPWVGSATSSWYKACGGFHTGVDVVCSTVYTCIPGTVMQINNDQTYSVLVQYDANHMMYYCNLTSVDVTPGQMLGAGVELGVANKYVHVEYWTRIKETEFIARFGTQTYYKQDPLEFLSQCKFAR